MKEESFLALSLRWLVAVRWGAGLTELCLAGLLLFGSEHRDAAPFMALVTLPTLLSNVWLARMARSAPPSPRAVFLMTLLDVAALSAWLALAGGPANPWSALYVVHVALAALLLEGPLTWLVVAASALGYRATFALAPDPHAAHGGGAFDAHLEGMYVAYVVSSTLVAYFVSRVATALRERDAKLATLRDRAARVERVAALTTLAAGAAHELGSPLGTIAVASRELERALEARGLPSELVEDARLVREEVGRCRAILDRMTLRAGASIGGTPSPRALESFVAAARDELGGRFARVVVHAEQAVVRLPEHALVPILTSLVGNALDATEHGGDVRLTLDRVVDDGRGATRVVVRDAGPGMDAATQERAFHPFFTTKAPGRGMGLGLFLVDAIVQELSGTVTLESSAGRGTTVTVVLPDALPEASG